MKDARGKSGGRVSQAVELIAGDLLHVSEGMILGLDEFCPSKSSRGLYTWELGPLD